MSSKKAPAMAASASKAHTQHMARAETLDLLDARIMETRSNPLLPTPAGKPKHLPTLAQLLEARPSQRWMLMQVRGPRSARAPYKHLQIRGLGSFTTVSAAAAYWKESPMFGRFPVRLFKIGKPYLLGSLDASSYYENGFEDPLDPEVMRRAAMANPMWAEHRAESDKSPIKVAKGNPAFAMERIAIMAPAKRHGQLMTDVLEDQYQYFYATGTHLEIPWAYSLAELQERKAQDDLTSPPIHTPDTKTAVPENDKDLPEDASVQVVFKRVHNAKKDAEEAQARFNEAIAKNPFGPEAFQKAASELRERVQAEHPVQSLTDFSSDVSRVEALRKRYAEWTAQNDAINAAIIAFEDEWEAKRKINASTSTSSAAVTADALADSEHSVADSSTGDEAAADAPSDASDVPENEDDNESPVTRYKDEFCGTFKRTREDFRRAILRNFPVKRHVEYSKDMSHADILKDNEEQRAVQAEIVDHALLKFHAQWDARRRAFLCRYFSKEDAEALENVQRHVESCSKPSADDDDTPAAADSADLAKREEVVADAAASAAATTSEAATASEAAATSAAAARAAAADVAAADEQNDLAELLAANVATRSKEDMTPEEREAAATALARACFDDLPPSGMVPGRAFFGIVVLDDLETKKAQTRKLDEWTAARDAVVVENEKKKLLELRAISHPEIPPETDPYFMPADAMASWLAKNPQTAGFNHLGLWTDERTEPTRSQRMEADAWLMDAAVETNKALWRFVGATHLPMRVEMCHEWLRENPLPSFAEDEPEPLVIPLPCFASEDDARAQLTEMIECEELYHLSVRPFAMYSWVTVCSRPKKRTVNASSKEYKELMEDLKGGESKAA